MAAYHGLSLSPQPDWRALVAVVRRSGTPDRVHHIELFHDAEVVQAIADRAGLLRDCARDDPWYAQRRTLAVNRYLGFDYVRAGLVGQAWPFRRDVTEDTAALKRAGGRGYIDEHAGPITNWEEFERYPWPDSASADATRDLEWYSQNLPEDMCLIGSGVTGHFAEYLTWLMGYETLCFALHDQRDLVEAIARRLDTYFAACLERILSFERVRLIWGSDDLGFRGGLLVSPDDTREFILPGHRHLAELSHAAGRPYLLHSCGNLADIMEDLIDDVRIDAKHSFEDTIEDVCEAKARYGDRIALLGGIDLDFLCRADESAIRRRVRDTLDVCQPGGGYCLGTGNSVANYIPLDSYLAMVDEGRLYGR
jgi:uroporphyrinogen decarboxylase